MIGRVLLWLLALAVFAAGVFTILARMALDNIPVLQGLWVIAIGAVLAMMILPPKR